MTQAAMASPAGMADKAGLAKWIGLIVMCMAQVGTSGDNAATSIATQALITGLGASMEQIALVNAMYPLIAGAFMIAGGMIGLILGWRTTFRIGAVMMIAAETACAMAPNIEVFIWGGRLMSGAGASFLIPAVLGLVAGTYKGRDLAIAFGAIGAISGVAMALAPLATGTLMDLFGFRMAFFAMAGYFALVLAGSMLITDVPKSANKVRFDPVGVLLAGSGLMIFILGTLKISSWGLFTPVNQAEMFGVVVQPFGLSPVPFLLMIGLGILFAFVKWEKVTEAKHGSCLMPSTYLSTPQVRSGLYMTALIFLGFGGAAFFVSSYMQIVGGFSAVKTGFSLIAFALGMTGFGLGTPILFGGASPRLVCRIGVVVSALACIPMAYGLHETGVNFLIYVALFVFASGLGLISSQSSVVIATAVSPRDAQQSGGIQATTRNVGQAVGLAILAVVFLNAMTSGLKDSVAADAQISAETKVVIEAMPQIQFMGNAPFRKLMSTQVANPADLERLVELNVGARLDAVRTGVFSMGGLILLFLAGTFNLPVRLPNRAAPKPAAKQD